MSAVPPVTPRTIEAGKWAGWTTWDDHDYRGYLRTIGPSFARRNSDGCATVAIETRAEHLNRIDTLHGGFLAAFADHAYFAALGVLDHVYCARGVTVDLTMQYYGVGDASAPLEAEVEVLRETGRMFFMRLEIRQAGKGIAASTATLRKPTLARV